MVLANIVGGLLGPRELAQVRELGVSEVRRLGEQATDVVPEGQPFVLSLWGALLRILGDGDAGLPSILEEGVPTGVFEPIPPCPMYPPPKTESAN